METSNCLIYDDDECPIAIDSHPDSSNEALFACGFLSGKISVCRFATEEPCCSAADTLWHKSHKRAIRRVRFSANGTCIYAITENKGLSVWDTETSRKVRCIQRAHNAAPYALCVVNEHTVATGDEAGCVRLWDDRAKVGSGHAAEFADVSPEYISDLAMAASNSPVLLATAGSTLSALNIKNKKIVMESEEMHSELLSVIAVHFNTIRRVLCGAEDGHIESFNEGEYGNIVERLETKHKDTVDCLRVVGTQLVANSSSVDGTIQLNLLEPNKCLGTIGKHDGGVVEMAVTANRRFLLSCGIDNKVLRWNINDWINTIPKHNRKLVKKMKLDTTVLADNFFADL